MRHYNDLVHKNSVALEVLYLRNGENVHAAIVNVIRGFLQNDSNSSPGVLCVFFDTGLILTLMMIRKILSALVFLLASTCAYTAPIGNTTFPWPVFDGSVPDTPVASAGHNTWYVDANAGNDNQAGTSFATAKKTIGAALSIPSLAAGDTILLGGGVYREYPAWGNAPGGKAGAPLTIGSYGRGTGRPVIDGGLKPATWTKYTGAGQSTVWQTSTAGFSQISGNAPVLGIYVNNGTAESALREVIHGQVSKYASDPLPPNQTQANITNNSNNWYFDAAGKTLYADFGGTLGAGDPNQADVSILWNSHRSGNSQLLIYLDSSHGYYNFVGLGIRASSWTGAYIESSGNTFDHCDIKFNGGASVVFSTPSAATQAASSNVVTQSRIWMNVLDNWPRFNNGNTGGGWPAGISWVAQSNALVQGNLIYQNGGEGIIFYGTTSKNFTSQNNVMQQNVIFDNFSVNVYLDNTTNATVQQNFVFDHPRDETQTFPRLLEASSGYATDFGRRLTPINLSLADEPGSSYDGKSHLANIAVLNNIFAGGSFGFVDYGDSGAQTSHGLKNVTIANNTWVVGANQPSGISPFGWKHTGTQSGGADPSSNSVFENNIIITADTSQDFAQMLTPPVSGVAVDYNVYGGPGMWMVGNNRRNFAGWQGAQSGWDVHSVNPADAGLADITEFSRTAADQLVYDWTKARPVTGSPTVGTGTGAPNAQTDFSGAVRGDGGKTIGALVSTGGGGGGGKAASSVALNVSPNPATSGQSVTMTATISSSGTTPTGTVTFVDGSTTLKTSTLSGGVASFSTSSLAVGTHNISASYSGSGTIAASTSTVTGLVVNASTTTKATSATALSVTPNPATSGQAVAMTATISSSGTTPTGIVTFTADGVALATASLASGAATYSTTTLGVGTHILTATYSGDAGNTGSTSPSTSVVINSSTTAPASINLNQFGLTGTWYQPTTSGQGLYLQVFPDNRGSGLGTLFAGWYTFDAGSAGGEEKQRWYTLQGNVDGTTTTAALGIYTAVGGNFDAPPKATGSRVGDAAIQFSDCTHATLAYSFTDGSGRTGSISLVRLDSNVTCVASGTTPPPPDYALSGSWYNPDTSGQGLFLVVNPTQRKLLAGWYTFAPNGAAIGGAASQRWYTLQLDDYTVGSNMFRNIPIYTATGGVFNSTQPKATGSGPIGTAGIMFQSCTSAVLTYAISGGSNAGKTGSIALTRLGGPAPGCAL
ncbi:MAG: Ig-like domain repeat protein [Proteobacteria bacterium]|nr:Ig-like domain repeat protein [Pseudomonadota bacterium]